MLCRYFYQHISRGCYLGYSRPYSNFGVGGRLYGTFKNMPKSDLTSWNSMIGCYARNGLGEKAIGMFSELKKAGLKPNSQTFLGLFDACGVVGDIREGLWYLDSMSKIYGITPTMEHYASIVHMFGSACDLDGALEFIENMPVEPNVDVWESLMVISRIQGNVVLGERCAQIVEKLDASRLTIETKSGLLPTTKHSVEREVSKVDPMVMEHQFVTNDRSHPEDQRIYALLESLKETLQVGVIRPHSEMLACAYVLLISKPRTHIYLLQNHDVCKDCCDVFKVLSKQIGRNITVNVGTKIPGKKQFMFHHFEDGKCVSKPHKSKKTKPQTDLSDSASKVMTKKNQGKVTNADQMKVEVTGKRAAKQKNSNDPSGKQTRFVKPQFKNQCTAFISNLIFNATSDQLHKFFSDTGGVQSIRIFKDKCTGKSTAYVDFSDDAHLNAAVAKNRKKFLNRRISIARSDQGKSKKSSIGHQNASIALKSTKTSKPGKDMSDSATEVTKKDQGKKTNADEMEGEVTGKRAAKQKNSNDPSGKQTRFVKPRFTNQCTAFISNLSFNATYDQLHKFFSDTGGVQSIRILKDKCTGKSKAYVDFSDDAHLNAALAKNRKMFMNRKISIARSDSGKSKKSSGGHQNASNAQSDQGKSKKNFGGQQNADKKGSRVPSSDQAKLKTQDSSQPTDLSADQSSTRKESSDDAIQLKGEGHICSSAQCSDSSQKTKGFSRRG